MISKENSYAAVINSLPKNDWLPLIELIPEIERFKIFANISESLKQLEQGKLNMHPYKEHPIIQQFRDVVYSIPIIIDFNWAGWHESHSMVGNKEFDYDSIDIPTKCKIITAIVRNDRFCSGRLVEAFESGLMLKVLKSILKQLKPVEF